MKSRLTSNINQQKPQNNIPAAPKKKPLEYIAINLPAKQIHDILEKTFASLSPEEATFFRQLQATRRIPPKFHVTLIHRASAKANPELWAKYAGLNEAAGGEDKVLGECQIQLERVVWSERLMAIVVRILGEDWESANAVPHVTVGTRAEDIKPRESNDLLEMWLQVGSGGETGIGEVGLKGVVLEGWVQGVLARH